jgi:hypothetical protein
VTVLPFIFHALLMIVDEAIHLNRGLKRWERWGHPLDTLTVLICVLFVLNTTFTESTSWVYIGLATFSTLFITKDEWVHAHECKAFEQWLHALLFILHPILLYIVYLFWSQGGFPQWFKAMPYGIALFGVYQLVYWNFVRRSCDQ